MSRSREEDAALEFDGYMRRSRAMWDWFFAQDAELARLELIIAKAARAMVEAHPDSPVYLRALEADRRARDARFELWTTRAGAKA